MLHQTFAPQTATEPAAHVAARKEGEAEFPIADLFFSRTDGRGVIQAFNGVFERIAGFAADELDGAPHRLVRHADMPKGLFHFMWDTIKAGKPIGAYVRNRTKGGQFYWVFALVSPIEGGYLSVRLKPTSAILGLVERIYADLLGAERHEGLTPEASAARLLAVLQAHGYPTYAAFQTRALAEEAFHRDAAMGQRSSETRIGLRRIVEGADALARARAVLSDHLSQIGTVSINMRIIAAHAEPGGGPISTISENYLLMSARIARQLNALADATGTRGAMAATDEEHALFVTSASDLMESAVAAFASDEGGLRAMEDIPLIQRVAAHYRSLSQHSLELTARMADRVLNETRDIRLALQGLDQVRMLCRIENGRFGTAIAGLAAIVEELDRSHALIQTHLDAIGKLSRQIVDDADMVLSPV